MQDNLIQSSFLLFVGIMVGNVFNYLFQVTMGRMLPVHTFGEMNALLSIMVIFSVPFASITHYLAKNVSHFCAIGEKKAANDLIIKSYKRVLIAGAIFVIIGAFLPEFIKINLKIDSVIPILLLFLAIFVSMVIPINTGVLQGLLNFQNLSILSAGSGFLRFILCVLSVIGGLGLNGIMAGISTAAALMGYFSFRPIRKHFVFGREPIVQDKEQVSLILPIVIGNLAFALLTQVDVVLVKYFYPPHDAGIYSAASIIGKTVMYLPGAIVLALFPMVASNKARDEATLHLILKALAITLLLSGSGAIILYLFPGEIVSIFFGNRFISAIPIIGLFAITMLPMAVVMILMNYNIARGKKYFAYVMLICAFIQIIGIINFHDSPVIILRVILYSGAFCMMTLFLMLTFEYYRSRLYNFTSYLVYKSFGK